MDMLDRLDARLSAVRDAFDRNFLTGAEVGAAVSIWRDGSELVELHGGSRDAARSQPWEPDTLVLIWSATKGLASSCVLHALEARGMSVETRVAEFWPEFAGHGKAEITVADVLSHRAGLGALDQTNLSLLDHDGVVDAIESQSPHWTPGSGHGYGPRTFGVIADELVRRLADGEPLGKYWRRAFGDPMDLDLWIGLPESEHDRVAQMLAARSGCSDAEDPFVQALSKPESLTRKAFSSPGGPGGATAMNAATARSASMPSLGGIGSARALARFYAMLAAGGVAGGVRYFAPSTMDLMTHPRSNGFDLVLQLDTAFSCGFMMDPTDEEGAKLRQKFGPSLRAFGHPGAGGSLAFADPDTGIGFAYVMNQMELGVLPKSRALSLVQAFYDLSSS